MTKADKALARQAWTESDWDGHVDIPKLIQLVRADEREACAAQLDFNAQASSNGGDEYIAALLWQEAEEIRARGNT